MYGGGLYGNYTWEGVHTQFSIRTYGKYIVKYIVKPNNVLFFDEKTQVKIYGKTMSLVEQCDYWGIKLTAEQRDKISKIDVSDIKHTSNKAYSFVTNVLFVNSTKGDKKILDIYGISYNGHNDQDTILMYDFRNITIVGYYDETKDKQANEKNIILLSKKHNYYNPENVSKQVLKNISKTQGLKTSDSNYKIIDGKLKDLNTKVNYLETYKNMNFMKRLTFYNEIKSQISDDEKNSVFNLFFLTDYKNYKKSEKEILFTSAINSLTQNEISKLFISFFLSDLSKLNFKNEKIDFVGHNGAEYYIGNIQLDTFPVKFGKSESTVLIDNCNKINNLDFMFSTIDAKLSIFNCENLTSLDGIQKLKITSFKQRSPYPKIILSNLPNLTSLKHLPNIDDCHLEIEKCPLIKFKDGFPSGITKLIYSSDENISDSDLQVLSKCKNLKDAIINDKLVIISDDGIIKYYSPIKQ